MAKSAQKKSEPLVVRVNLLHPQGEPLQLPAKFLKWLVGYGRFIVIFVEIIVIACFLYRFKLDADLERINQGIRAEAQTIESKAKDEILVRQTQQRLQLIKQTYTNTPDWKILVESVTAKVPQGVTFTNLTTEHLQNSKDVQFKIVARTNSTSDVSAFISSLRELDKEEKDRRFNNINLANVSFEEGTIDFTVTGSTR